MMFFIFHISLLTSNFFNNIEMFKLLIPSEQAGIFAYFVHWHIYKHLRCAYNIAAGTKTPVTEAVVTIQLNKICT